MKKLQNQNRNTTFTNKQRGASTVDVMIAAGFIIGAILLTVMIVPKVQDAMTISSFQRDASTIQSSVLRWKKARSNYTGVTLSEICNQNILTKGGTICGTSNNGQATNPFGGNWTVRANSNPGLFDIVATLPNNPDSIAEVADTMAPITRGNCQSASGCATLQATGTTLTMTF
ncbi:hypothetical protein TUM4438_40390 [Shewanella sairae]|uniref:Uncharacterized protein n=1 Tax=Shewanella sairae TaxID=190310 RepID=A0ABQ4PQN7_9GAMM|nr:hypothetical protein [Shewanella sairae]MCL1132243.1 hypothetical protein [Shewanella sairae]GIU51290.1 hypothetical protein TUM4438_40390 [Shewanella sairae]